MQEYGINDLLQNIQNRYYIKPADALETYCKLEGVDPLCIYRSAKKRFI